MESGRGTSLATVCVHRRLVEVVVDTFLPTTGSYEITVWHDWLRAFGKIQELLWSPCRVSANGCRRRRRRRRQCRRLAPVTTLRRSPQVPVAAYQHPGSDQSVRGGMRDYGLADSAAPQHRRRIQGSGYRAGDPASSMQHAADNRRNHNGSVGESAEVN